VFPPKVTASPEELLTNLWASVSRAGPVFRENGKVIPREGRAVECHFYFAPGGVSPAASIPLAKYMRGYARESGWKVRSLRFTKHYAALVMAPSSAASKAARKP
jgi:hypothetical protein